VETGQLDGYYRPSSQRGSWFVYADQLPIGPVPPAQDPAAELDAARTEVSRLTAELDAVRSDLVTAQETNRLLLAAQAELVDAIAEYEVGATETAAGATGLQTVIDAYQQSNAHLLQGEVRMQAAADKFRKVVALQRDALAQFTTAGHLGEL
jgi:hypothetical protein